jgi:hypothetical protein
VGFARLLADINRVEADVMSDVFHMCAILHYHTVRSCLSGLPWDGNTLPACGALTTRSIRNNNDNDKNAVVLRNDKKENNAAVVRNNHNNKVMPDGAAFGRRNAAGLRSTHHQVCTK